MSRKDKQHLNGNGSSPVVVLSRVELEAQADRIARELLDVSGKRGLQMLKQGKLRGTIAEAELSAVQYLLAQ